MKTSEIIKAHRAEITSEMVDCYRSVLNSDGGIQYKIFIWDDGKIERLEQVQGDNSWLQANDGSLHYITTISSPFFYAGDYTDDPEPDDEAERETWRQAVIEYLVDEYSREGVSDAMDVIIDDAERDEEYDV